jgi:hypothetical protein
MADYTAFERLFGLPEGSTEGNDINKIAPVIAKGIKDTTNQIEKAVKRVDTLEAMAPSELVKHGITLEILEQDKIDIRERAWKTYNIAEKILERYEADVTRLTEINDRMYTAGGKLIEAVTGSLDKLYGIIQKIRQEEEMKNLTIIQEDDESKVMTTADWRTFIESVSDDDIDAKDAEIIE